MATRKSPLRQRQPGDEPARIEFLHVENYRALKTVELKSITPLTVLLGPNGSGKSTIFDVFNFLSECFQFGLRYVGIGVDEEGLKTRGQDTPSSLNLNTENARSIPSLPTISPLMSDRKGRW